VRQLGHRHGLAGEQGLVHLQLALHKPRVGGNPVAFMQHQQVAAHHVAPGDPLLLAVAQHQRARAERSRSDSSARCVLRSCTSVMR